MLPRHSIAMKAVITALASTVLLGGQTPKFSYSATIELVVTAPGFEAELRSELAREFERIDGVRIVEEWFKLDPPKFIVHVVAAKTPAGIIAAAAAVTVPIQGLLNSKVLGPSEDPLWKGTDFRRSGVMEELIVFTGGIDRIPDLARRIVASVHSGHLIADRDLKYRLFQALHP
jgi:hypothetical protein